MSAPLQIVVNCSGNGFIDDCCAVSLVPSRDMREQIAATLRLHLDSNSNLDLYRLQRPSVAVTGTGWCLRVTPSNRSAAGQTQGQTQGQVHSVSAAELCAADVIIARVKPSPVGPKLFLSCLMSDNHENENLRGKLQQMSLTYEGFRTIRGDGNCYYRAVCFGLLEQIIEQGALRHFQRIEVILRSLTNDIRRVYGLDACAHHRTLLTSLAEAASKYLCLFLNAIFTNNLNVVSFGLDGKKWKCVSEFENEVVSQSELDLSLIRAARALTCSYLQEHALDVVDKSMSLQELCIAYAEVGDDIR